MIWPMQNLLFFLMNKKYVYSPLQKYSANYSLTKTSLYSPTPWFVYKSWSWKEWLLSRAIHVTQCARGSFISQGGTAHQIFKVVPNILGWKPLKCKKIVEFPIMKTMVILIKVQRDVYWKWITGIQFLMMELNLFILDACIFAEKLNYILCIDNAVTIFWYILE